MYFFYTARDVIMTYACFIRDLKIDVTLEHYIDIVEINFLGLCS